MSLRQMLRPTNRRVRYMVGLALAALVAVQCTRTEAFKESTGVVVLDGKAYGKQPSAALKQVDQLARTDHIALLEYCLEHYRGKFHDYTCTFTKQESIAGTVKPRQVIDVKYLDAPFSVAMTWRENAPVGDKVLYVEGGNGGKMLVRPTSPLLRKLAGGGVWREPAGPEAMRSTLRPVNLFGFRRSTESLLEIYRLAKRNGDLAQSFGGYADVQGRRTAVLVRNLPDKPEYRSAACKTLVYVDLEYLVPVRIEGFGWQGEESSFYEYTDVKFNIGLGEKDFTPRANDIELPS